MALAIRSGKLAASIVKKRRVSFVVGSVGLTLLAAVAVACEDSTEGSGTPDSGVVTLDGGPSLDSSSNPTDSGSTPDTSSNADASDAGGDGGEPPLLPPDFFVSPTGDDANDGKTAAKPLKTLCKARDLAQANQVIGLLDGTYDNGSQRPVNWVNTGPCSPIFNVPVTVQAVNSGQAIVRVELHLNQGGSVRGIKLDNERTDAGSVFQGSIEASAGTLTIRSVSVGDVGSPPNAKQAPLVFSGTVKVTMFPGDVTNYTYVPVPAGRGQTLAFVTGTSELTIEGGTIDDSAVGNPDSFCNPLFEGGGKVTLKGVTVHHKGTIIRAYATASFEQGTVLEDRSAALGNLACTPVIGFLGAAVDIKVTDSTIRGGASGIEAEPGVQQGLVTVTNSTIEGASQYGINLNSAGLKVRGSTVKSADVGIRLGLNATADLGKVGDVGGNTFSGSTTTALRVESTTVVNAAGNTWIANQQGSDAQGKYPAAELKVGPLTGLNFTLTTAAQSTQL